MENLKIRRWITGMACLAGAMMALHACNKASNPSLPTESPAPVEALALPAGAAVCGTDHSQQLDLQVNCGQQDSQSRRWNFKIVNNGSTPLDVRTAGLGLRLWFFESRLRCVVVTGNNGDVFNASGVRLGPMQIVDNSYVSGVAIPECDESASHKANQSGSVQLAYESGVAVVPPGGWVQGFTVMATAAASCNPPAGNWDNFGDDYSGLPLGQSSCGGNQNGPFFDDHHFGLLVNGLLEQEVKAGGSLDPESGVPSCGGACSPTPTFTATPTATSTFTATATSTFTATPTPAGCHPFLLQWPVTTAIGLSVDATGVYVTSDSTGTIVVNPTVSLFNTTGTLLTQWGTAGNGPGQFSAPDDVATDAAGNVYVLNILFPRIEKFTAFGAFVSEIGNGLFGFPGGIAVDPSGNIYEADTGSNFVEKLDPSGNLLVKWGGVGSGPGQFLLPGRLGANANGVYVADFSNQRIQQFDLNGNFIRLWGSVGTAPGQFQDPTGVAFDAAGDVYVSERGNNRVQEFTSTGNFICQFGSMGSGPGQFNDPEGIGLDASGNVYVADLGDNRVEKFGP